MTREDQLLNQLDIEQWKVDRMNELVEQLERVATSHRMAYVRLVRELPLLLLAALTAGFCAGVIITNAVR